MKLKAWGGGLRIVAHLPSVAGQKVNNPLLWTTLTVNIIQEKCWSPCVCAALLGKHEITRALNQTDSSKKDIWWFSGWDLRLSAGSLWIKYAGFCHNSSSYLGASADEMPLDIVLHSDLEGFGRTGDNVTAVLTRDTSESWKHKHLPFCLTGIHIRRSSALQKAPDLRPGGSCASELTGQT